MTTPRTTTLFQLCGCAFGILAAATCRAQELADVPYGIGKWPEAGRGNHRAIVRVEAPADAVRVLIPWRRRDQAPETKDIRLFDAKTGQRVTNVVRLSVTREQGLLAFQPPTAPGDYEVYYLPYNPPKGHFDAPGAYFRPEETADPAWCSRCGLTPEAIAAGQWQKLPEARVTQLQARNEFGRFDPMEVIATEEETKALLARFPKASVMLFPEDRQHPIRMTEDLPRRWTRQGPSETFSGTFQPGEYAVFQIGLWAARQAVADLKVELTPFASTDKKIIPRDRVTCFNSEGTDWLGRPMAPVVAVDKGKVQALWFGVQLPADATGSYSGTITLQPSGLPASTVRVRLDVKGEPLPDAGDSQLWRQSRLRWLNSTIGLDDEVVPPFTPLQVAGNQIALLGRQVDFGSLGLPERLSSGGREILASPMRLVVETGAGEASWTPVRTETPKQAPGAVERRTEAQSGSLRLTVESRTEADGCITFRAALRSQGDTDVGDIRFELPLRQDVARYLMGMGRRGGYRPEEWVWRWNIEKADNMVWIGDADAGVQLKLMTDSNAWEMRSLKQSGLPESWHNAGRGGCTIRPDGETVLAKAFSGPRSLKAGDELVFRFRLLVTPFKPIDPNHWNWRYGGAKSGGNIMHLHHGTWQNPYINYPFLTPERIAEQVQRARKQRLQPRDHGRLEYPARGNIQLGRGAVHVWMRVNFDPTEGGPRQAEFNQQLFNLRFPNQDLLGFYWNVDDRGMRAYVRKGPPEQNRYPVLISSHSREWRRGQRHHVTLSWGDRFEIYIDGKRGANANRRGTLDTSLDGAVLEFTGGFAIDAVKITDQPYAEGAAISPAADENTLFLETFSEWDGKTAKPAKAAAGTVGTVEGVVETHQGTHGNEVVFSARLVDTGPRGLNLYYTVRELSNHVAEMWALRSLGDEIFPTSTSNPMKVGNTTFGAGGGYAWLREHLVSGYVTGWRQPLPEDTDAAIKTQGLSRWHNYYLEGLGWLMRNTGMDGLYLDGIGYDREIMKRVAKVMYRENPNYRINYHSGDNFSPPWDPGRGVSAANQTMEHFPYISNLWFGELFDYNRSPDYWLVEISGIPFGLTGEMLNYRNGGNPYRGMVYGMTGRQHRSAPFMWEFWDQFGIQDAEMLGYWDKRCPVRTTSPEVLATVYRKKGSSAIALGHWPSSGKEPPRAYVAPIPKRPTVDGKLAPGEWDQASRLTRFSQLGQDYPPPLGMEVYITHDQEALYLAWRCATGGAEPLAKAKTRDGTVWEDDAVEVFILTDPETKKYVQFIGNSAGVFFDGKGVADAGKWDGPWEYRASVEAGAWCGELSVPFDALGMGVPKRGDAIGFNICRDQQKPSGMLSSWGPAEQTFHEIGAFGHLIFATVDTVTQEPVGPVEKTGDGVVSVRLLVDWEALGIDRAKARLRAPAIKHFQDAAEFAPGDEIPVERAKGWLLVVE